MLQFYKFSRTSEAIVPQEGGSEEGFLGKVWCLAEVLQQDEVAGCCRTCEV